MVHRNLSIITDVSSRALTQEDIAVITHPLVHGIILFSHNFACSEQLTALVSEIRQIKPEIIICVDHEGGRVQRFCSDQFTRLPAMQLLGNLFSIQPHTALDLARKTGWLLAEELGDHGIDFSFTPVLDLDAGYNQVIADRSFSADPEVVTCLAEALIQGIHATGIKVVAKHFPGHGHVTEDSHKTLPIDKRSLLQIADHDLLPFQYLIQKGLVDAVMPAHVLYPNIDALPAGFSPYWLQHLLRGQLRFSGLIISDDLSMLAVASIGSIEYATDLAIAAGADALLVCQNPENTLKVLAHLDARQIQPGNIRTMQRIITGYQPPFSREEVKDQLAHFVHRH